MTPRSPLFVNDSAAHRVGLHPIYALRPAVERRTAVLHGRGGVTIAGAIWEDIFLSFRRPERHQEGFVYVVWDEAQARMPKRKEDG